MAGRGRTVGPTDRTPDWWPPNGHRGLLRPLRYVVRSLPLPHSLADRTTQLARRRRSSNHFIWQNTISLIGSFAPYRRGVFTATCRVPGASSFERLIGRSSHCELPTPNNSARPSLSTTTRRPRQFDRKLAWSARDIFRYIAAINHSWMPVNWVSRLVSTWQTHRLIRTSTEQAAHGLWRSAGRSWPINPIN